MRRHTEPWVFTINIYSITSVFFYYTKEHTTLLSYSVCLPSRLSFFVVFLTTLRHTLIGISCYLSAKSVTYPPAFQKYDRW